MLKKSKRAIIFLIVLAIIAGGAVYAVQKNKERLEREKTSQDQLQKASDEEVQDNHISEDLQYKAVYSVCDEDKTSVFAYDAKSRKNTIIFTDEDKDYILPCDLSSARGELADGTLTFTAKDKETKKEYAVTFDLDSKFEKKAAYDPYAQSEEDTKTEKKGNYNVLVSTVKKSPDGKRLMFAADDQNLYVADSDYENVKKMSDFTAVKCVNGGSTIIDYDENSRGWLADKKMFFDDSGLKCSGNGSFIVDVESGKVSKLSDPLVYVPAQTMRADNNFIAVVNSGNGNRIVIMNAESGDVVQEIDKGTYVIVAPDNSRIFYESHPGEDLKTPGKLYVADADGGNKSEVEPGADGMLYLLGWMK